MTATDVSLEKRIRSFTASVREHLDDLPADELDEIVGGLSADLAEQAADNEGRLELGEPASYAEELRLAAGLPPRGRMPKRAPFREGLAAWRRDITEGMRRSAFGSWLLDFLVTLRPVWWVLRGAVVAAILFTGTPVSQYSTFNGSLFSASLLEWLVLMAIIVVSVQWGRGRWLPKNAFRHVLTVINVLAVIATPFVLGVTLAPRVEYVDTGGYVPQGLILDGVQINNIFAFDAEGNPIEQVQLFTGKGTPLNLYGRDGASNWLEGDPRMQYGVHDDGQYATFPLLDYRGQPIWNVYPLDEARMDDEGTPKVSKAKRPQGPFLRAPSLSETDPSPSPTPSVTPGAVAPQPTDTPAH